MRVGDYYLDFKLVNECEKCYVQIRDHQGPAQKTVVVEYKILAIHHRQT